MTAAAVNDAWQGVFMVSISKIGGSEMAAHGITESFKLKIGGKPVSTKVLGNGGRIACFGPEEDAEVEFESYPLEAGTDTGTTLKGWSDLMHTVDTTVPVRITNDRTRDKYRVAIMWTNDTTATTAVSAIAVNYSALRYVFADGYFTEVEPELDGDGKVVKITAKFYVPAFDKSGNSCKMVESCAGTGPDDILPAIGAYTTSNKFG